MPTELTLEQAQGALAAQPFSNLIGARLDRCDSEQVELVVPVRDNLRQQAGFLHGGVIAYAADNALTYAGAMALGPSVLTGGFTIRYLAPVSHGELLAVATITGVDGRKAESACELYEVAPDGTRTHCATATGTTILRRSDPAVDVD